MTTTFAWGGILGALLDGGSLDADTCREAMARIVAGDATPAQIAAFAVALRAKGETAAEVEGLVAAMLEVSLPLAYDGVALDIVGTGGDASHSVNISTLSAIVAAGAGVPVIKHGNRAATSSCGSADVLAELGVKIDLGPEGVVECVDRAGIGFCFAPVFHPALRHAGPARREIGVPTVFNILGPLANPAQPAASLIGAANLRLAPVMARVFADAGRRALVVRGRDGLDEITVEGGTDVWDATTDDVRIDEVAPEMVGVESAPVADLVGGDAATNAAIARRLLAGEAAGPLAAVRSAVVLNAAAGLVAWDAAAGESRFGSPQESAADRLARAVPAAEQAIDSGRARDVLASWVEVSAAVG
jgi:anthranilate phosphoribosyltransferase